MTKAAGGPVAGLGSPEKMAASVVNSFRLESVMDRLRFLVQAPAKSDTREFQICCISSAKGIDFAIANNDIPRRLRSFPCCSNRCADV